MSCHKQMDTMRQDAIELKSRVRKLADSSTYADVFAKYESDLLVLVKEAIQLRSANLALEAAAAEQEDARNHASSAASASPSGASDAAATNDGAGPGARPRATATAATSHISGAGGGIGAGAGGGKSSPRRGPRTRGVRPGGLKRLNKKLTLENLRLRSELEAFKKQARLFVGVGDACASASHVQRHAGSIYTSAAWRTLRRSCAT